jgi:hypothetical protein
MKTLGKLRQWWRGFWGCEGLPNAIRRVWGPDLGWPTGVDSHRWENKTEILRRLGTCP